MLPDRRARNSPGVFFASSLYVLAESHDLPELHIACQLIDLAWRRLQAADDLRHRWQTLSHRQQQIALLIYRGLTYPQIARRLDLGLQTVRSHARLIHTKMGIASSQELRALMLRAEIFNEYLDDYQAAASLQDPQTKTE